MSDIETRVDAVRRFSRFYTKRIGLLADGFLGSEYSLTEARVIYELAQSEAQSPTGLASELELDPGYVSRVVKRFEQRGLVAREPSPDDGRKVVLRLTALGRTAFDELATGSRAQIQQLLSSTDEEGQRRVIEAMQTVEGQLSGEPRRPTVTYRAHRPGDFGWIVERHGAIYHESHGWDATFEAMVAGIAKEFLERFDPAWERSWIAEVDGRRAGNIALVRRSKTVGQLRLLFVESWARGLGIGTRLVSECVGQARHVGYRKMVLFTVAGLDPARRLYEAEGFRLTEETPGHSWGKDHIAQTWELKL